MDVELSANFTKIVDSSVPAVAAAKQTDIQPRLHEGRPAAKDAPGRVEC